MNLPQVYMCSPPWTPLPPPSPHHPSGSSQCTSPKHPVSCIEPGLATRFIHDILHVSIFLKSVFKINSPWRISIIHLPTTASFIILVSIHYCDMQGMLMSALFSPLFFDSVLKDSLKLIGLDPVVVNLVAKSQFLIYHGDTFLFCSFSTCARTSSKK